MRKLRYSSFGKDGDSSEPQVNITPLIDVVFVVLISFILIAPLLQIEEIELSKGGEQTKALENAEKSRIQVQIDANNEVRLNKILAKEDHLPQLLCAWRARWPAKRRALVFCDHRASFGTYQRVKCTLEGAGFEHLELVLIPSDRNH